MPEITVVKKVKNGALLSNGNLRIENVRASYPSLFKPFVGKDDKGVSKARYSIVGLGPKETHQEAAKLCVEIINKLLKENNVDRLAADRKFTRDGNLAAKDGYDDNWTFSAGDTDQPKLRGADGRPLGEKDSRVIYGGCIVTILIRPWFMRHPDYGIRVNAGLVAVKFERDGEAFGQGRITDDEVDGSFEYQVDGSFGGKDEDDDALGL